jgi:hypothetical protein
LTGISVLLAIGLCSLRKWAAVLFSTFALVVMAYLAATDLSVKEAVLLIPIAATPLAWRRLREASGQFIFGSIVIAVAIGTAIQLVTYFVWFRR